MMNLTYLLHFIFFSNRSSYYFNFIRTVTDTMKLEGKIISFIQFIGTPVIAVGIGLLITIYGLTRSLDKQKF